MTDSDTILGLVIVGVGVASFIYLNSNGTHMSSKMKYKGGRWMMETTTTHNKTNTLEKKLLDEENKRRQSLLQYEKLKAQLKHLSVEAMSKDLISSIVSKSYASKNLIGIFKQGYAQEALEIITKDYRKQSRVYTQYDFEMYSDNQLNNPNTIPRYILSDDILFKLFQMWNRI